MKVREEQFQSSSFDLPKSLLLCLLALLLSTSLSLSANAQTEASQNQAGRAQSSKPAKTPTPTPTPTPAATPVPTVTPTPAPGSVKPAPGAKPAQTPFSNEELGEARKLLDALGYWVNLDATEPDVSLRHALIAFQKSADRPRTGVLTQAELQALRQALAPAPLETGYDHIEVDLQRQILFIVDSCNASVRILPISSGSGEWFTEGGVTRRAVTPPGRFKVQRKIAGWRKSPLGLLYYPNYFYDGYAIHGNPLVPARPASHGCIRIPMFAAKEFFEFATIGMPVIVHSGVPITITSTTPSSEANLAKQKATP
jgi:lipoprotein-anchoring transpeptidase ErfK/SrfK